MPGDDENHFNWVTDIAWLPEGTFFVSDGYRNTRVLKFSADGEFLMQWGEPGESGSETRPGYMNTVHRVAVDAERRVYVSDRSNHRVNEDGNYLSEIPEHRPYYIYVSDDQHLWVSDGDHSKIMKFSLDGKLLYSWGTFGTYPGAMWGPHQFSVDSENNLYISDVHVGRVQKCAPKPGVNPPCWWGRRSGGEARRRPPSRPQEHGPVVSRDAMDVLKDTSPRSRVGGWLAESTDDLPVGPSRRRNGYAAGTKPLSCLNSRGNR